MKKTLSNNLSIRRVFQTKSSNNQEKAALKATMPTKIHWKTLF